MEDEQTEWFTALGARVTGVVGLVVVGAVVLLGVTGVGGAFHPAAYAVCGLVAVVIWVVLLRPGIGLGEEWLILRNPLSTVHLPLAAIEQVAVGQWLAVLVGGRRYTNSGVGRSGRQARKDDGLPGETLQRSFGGIVEMRIERRAENARSRLRITRSSEEQAALAAEVRREPARVEIGLIAVLALAVVVTFFL